MVLDQLIDSRHPKLTCATCVLIQTRYRCKGCGEPTCFACWNGEHHQCHGGHGVDETNDEELNDI